MDKMNNEIFGNLKTAEEILFKVKARIEEISIESGYSGVPSGFEKLDKITSGWQPSDLIIIASQTSIGKSAFIISMIKNISVDFSIPALFFSPEMSSGQIMQRLISMESGINTEKLRTGKLEKHEWELLSVNTKNLEKAPIFIDDSTITIDQLCYRSKKLVEENNVKIIFIDNIHLLLSGNKGNGDITREHEISIISRRLKALAKELEIPIIAISQLSRAVEYRSNVKRPVLSDLRGSGTLEEIADIVSFIHRPEFDKIDEWDDEEQSPTAGQAEFIIAKHRNGILDNFRLKFISNIIKFENLDDYDTNENYLPTTMNLDNDDNPFKRNNLPTVNEAFGSNMNNDDDSDVPF